MRIYFDTEFLEDGKTIELISIGLVREDGAEFYAETPYSDRIAYNEPWLREHVWPHLLGPGAQMARDDLAAKLKVFCGERPEFWAWYADYDWVALCQLFGPMIDLPDGWPMYCRDLKQVVDMMLTGQKPPKQETGEHHALDDAKWCKGAWEWANECAIAQCGLSLMPVQKA